MPSPEQMIAAVHAYVDAFDKSDPDLVAALFADDATVADPVGTPLKVGIAAIHEFYAGAMQTGAKLQLHGPIRLAADNFAAFAFDVRLHLNDADICIDVIDVFRFNEEGKIAEMSAFFGPANMAAA
jgi:steroid Delta-isomerase